MKRFEEGKEYSCNSVCDHNCMWTFEVIRRTEKTVWLKETKTGENHRRRIEPSHMNESEMCSPFGNYSMSPILRAIK